MTPTPESLSLFPLNAKYKMEEKFFKLETPSMVNWLSFKLMSSISEK